MIHVSIARSSEKLKELIAKLVLVGDFNATQTAPTGAASNQKGEVSKWDASKVAQPNMIPYDCN